MTVARWIGAGIPLLLLTATTALIALLHAEHRQTRPRHPDRRHRHQPGRLLHYPMK